MVTMATPLVSYSHYLYENCDGLITSANLAPSYCVGVENFPIKSFTAYVSSGACDDSKSPVLNIYSGTNCESGLVQTVSVNSENQCFAADTTVQSWR
ncbi:hypothetical protein BDV37DRAFT_246970 [Aspergillus pseudonomiae]|uniref:Uncharacterized protein n=1 Tax=Aspergillus pseudonomiae TaxID=1506151 RepID=A0A5N7DFK6_9EURO|nr:uncharacterized protein BDV37DRAFT_246970 [Aspergillus pseudonomiae]KAE8404793.1 hypothetical protein BDV37DRAFT_246970 [Aspergillus pseudonomiae]